MALPLPLLRLRYEETAEAYLKSLPLEHFMESTSQATQRKITLCAFDLVHEDRPDFQPFNELLIQYRRKGQQKIRQVVPDNMVVLHETAIRAEGSYDIELQPVRPFWVLEYVSKHNRRKDYEASFDKYEKDVKAPYYLLFYPDAQELMLFHLVKGRYVSIQPNRQGRLPVRRVHMEVAIVDGWARYWYQGKLLPLTGELGRELDRQTRRAEAALRLAGEETRRADVAEQENQRLREELERLRGK